MDELYKALKNVEDNEAKMQVLRKFGVLTKKERTYNK